MQRRQLPFLDVRSDFLVYVTNVPSALNGKELKNRINAQYGIVKFIETFEAWARRRIGCIVIEFSTFNGSDAFMRAAIEHRIPYLGDVGVQHVGIVGRRHFFELIHRDTDIDLLDCNGQPYDNSWKRNKRDRFQRSKPYNYESKTFNRGAKPKQIVDESIGDKDAGVTLPRAQRHNSPSSDESVGPFPSSSGALRKLIKFSVWQSKITGRTHVLTFDSDKKEKSVTSPNGQRIGRGLRRGSLVKKNKTKTFGFGNNKIVNHNQIVSERLDRLRAKYDMEASTKVIGESGGCFIPLASKKRNSIVRPAKPSAAVLPMKITGDLEDGEIPDEEENGLEDGELGEEPMELCSDQEDNKKLLQVKKIKVRSVKGYQKILVTKSPNKNAKKDEKWQKLKITNESKKENKTKTEKESPQKSQKNTNDSGSYSSTDDGLDFDFPFELVEGNFSPEPKKPLDTTNSLISMDIVSNKEVEKLNKNGNESEDEIINVEDILEGESIAGDIDERCLDDNYADHSPITSCGKIQIKHQSTSSHQEKVQQLVNFLLEKGQPRKLATFDSDVLHQQQQPLVSNIQFSACQLDAKEKQLDH